MVRKEFRPKAECLCSHSKMNFDYTWDIQKLSVPWKCSSWRVEYRLDKNAGSNLPKCRFHPLLVRSWKKWIFFRRFLLEINTCTGAMQFWQPYRKAVALKSEIISHKIIEGKCFSIFLKKFWTQQKFCELVEYSFDNPVKSFRLKNTKLSLNVQKRMKNILW